MEEAKQRMIQEYVPGRQVTLAHVIANPQDELARKVGLTNEKVDAIGILTITPGEAAIIAGDLATKSAAIEIGFVDRFSGSVILNGDVSSVEAAISDIVDYFKNVLRFSVTEITRSKTEEMTVSWKIWLGTNYFASTNEWIKVGI